MKKTVRIYYLCLFISCLFACSNANPVDNEPVDGKITSFSITDQKSTKHNLNIDNASGIISNKQMLPDYVNLFQAVASFETNSRDLTVKVNGEVQISGLEKNDFTQERVYDLYSSDKKLKSYTVRITKKELLNNFLSFSFPEKRMESYQPSINVETGAITNESKIPANVDITSLSPVFSTTGTNTVVKVAGTVQKSGINSHNFTRPVVYTVEGEDGTSKNFTVTLEQSDEIYLTNPLLTGSYADPTVYHNKAQKEFYVYVTGARVRGYRSRDLVNWTPIKGTASEVFTTKPNITGESGADMWAPDINYFDGKYVMYCSMSVWGGGATCGIGVWVSSLPEGPFLPPPGNSNGKLFVSSEIGVNNSIDPCFYEENGKRYLFWGSFSGIYMTELTADGMAVKDLTKKTKVAGNSFEATYIHKRGNYYYLFASVGACCEGMSSSYKVVVGRSQTLEGPYLNKAGADMKTFDAWNPTNYQPVVVKGDAMFGGPGHNSRIITDDDGVDWMLYHSYVNNGNDSRQLMLDKIEWDAGGWPVLGNGNGTPSHTMQIVPVFK
jgi:arabinan endo-1,5-alpha-L-arabinosidase